MKEIRFSEIRTSAIFFQHRLGSFVSSSYKRWIFPGSKDVHILKLTADTHLLFFLYYYLVCEAIGTRVIVRMIMEKQMECRLAGETEVLGKILPQRNFCPSQNTT
jgi:hypothetical protein